MLTERDLEVLAKVANREMGVWTFEPRGRDGLDFYEVYVDAVKRALVQAFEFGFAQGQEANRLK